MSNVTAGERAYRKLRDALRSGIYAPKQRLVESEVAGVLGVNRLGLREALTRLEHEGLVDRVANRGATVRLLTVEEALEVLEVRSMLEGLLAQHAARKARQKDVSRMTSVLADMKRLVAVPDIPRLTAAQESLHQLITEVADFPVAARLVDTLSAQTAQSRLRSDLVPGRLTQSLHEHRAIVEAIAAKDPDAAERALREHLANVAEAVRSTQ